MRKLYGNKRNKLTPYQGKNRAFGSFRCNYCLRHWYSGNSWANHYQVCKGCNREVYPYRQIKLKKQPNYIGTFKCYNCSNKFMRYLYYEDELKQCSICYLTLSPRKVKKMKCHKDIPHDMKLCSKCIELNMLCIKYFRIRKYN